jgi:dienelactone hydrolase
LNIQRFEYRHQDTVLVGQLIEDGVARPGPRPGVLVFPEGGGLGEHPKRRARQLAELGYIVLACDMYGGGLVARDADEARALFQGLLADLPKLRGRAEAALQALVALPRIDRRRLGAIGFCFGGLVALELARSGAAVAGVVSFHGILRTTQPAVAGTVTAKVLACHGHRDPFVSPAELTGFMAEMESAGVDWQVLAHAAAGHGFTNPATTATGIPGVGYEPNAERRSWAAMLAFFAELFVPA